MKESAKKPRTSKRFLIGDMSFKSESDAIEKLFELFW